MDRKSAPPTSGTNFFNGNTVHKLFPPSSISTSSTESLKKTEPEPLVTVDRSSGPGLSPILKRKLFRRRKANSLTSHVEKRSISMGTDSSRMEIGNTADAESYGEELILYPRKKWSSGNFRSRIKKRNKGCADKCVQTISESSVADSSCSNIEPFWDKYG